MDEIIALRHNLHSYPELSGNENKTSITLINYLLKYPPDELHKDIGGRGIAAIYNGKVQGKTVLVRCDMDAVPIQEKNDIPYKSKNECVAHLCGHDGHMAIVSGIAKRLKENPIEKGRVILFYQPEEENGKGAKRSVEELRKLNLVPDCAFAIHNMPKYPFGSIILGKYTFSAASKGIIIKLFGRNAHAAYPESGINPSNAVAELIQILNGLNQLKIFNQLVLATIIHVRIGEIAFGISPGYAEVMATLRAFDNFDMIKAIELCEKEVKEIASKNSLTCEVSYTDDFPATACNPDLTREIEDIANAQKRNVIYLSQPNRWSEDFAHFTSAFPAVIFGLGAGENHPDLHTNNYDFPDEIIPIGIEILEDLARKLT